MLQFLGLASTQQADKLVQAAAFRIISPTIRASMRMSHLDATPSRADGQPDLAPVVYLVDDDPSFLRALSRRLQAAGYQVEAFSSAEQFLRRRRSEAPGCAVLDLRMPGPGGLGLQEALVKAEEPLPVVFLTAHGDVPSSVQAMKGGAVDFLTKPVQGNELVEAVERALARGAAAREARRHKRAWRARYESLTQREREVFTLIVRGLLNKQIADVLHASERTIKAHRAQVMHKMGVQSPAELGGVVKWLDL
jgi:FixJ family two-component response regulator